MDAAIAASPLLASPGTRDLPAILGGASDWTWGEVHAAALALSERLEPDARIANLCSSRCGFLITWIAALRRRCLQVLPSSSAHADLVAALETTGITTVVVDDPAFVKPDEGLRTRYVLLERSKPVATPGPDALAWSPDWDVPCVCLYTSGTTGTPEPQLKTLRQLSTGALVLAARLGAELSAGIQSWRAIVCSVPPQHMFGLETSVMLPLIFGMPVLDRRPLLPLDVLAAIRACAGPVAWISTPLHLRAVAQTGQVLPDCRLTLVSTMPLTPSLAKQVERLTDAPVIEIFGSTETGVLATRRTAQGTHWTLVDEVRVEIGDAQETRAWGRHFHSPSKLADHLAMEADGRFQLLGREADLIKIGGRRASLAGLNLLLQDFPGLEDGVFYLPGSGSPTERLVLIHAGPPLDRGALERWLRERMDPVFLPRSVLRVDRLPRADNGKLPRTALDALYAAQRVLARPTRGPVEFEFRVTADHPCLPGHFPGHPIVPGVLVLDHVMEGLRGATGCNVTRLTRVRFTAALEPQETARVRYERREGKVSFRVSTLRHGTAQSIADGTAVLATSSTAEVTA